MSIPKYNEMYKEFLLCLSDGEPHKSSEVKEKVYQLKGITESDRAVLIPAGTQRLVDNRLGWTRTYLKKAGLISTPQRSFVQLTNAGKELVENMPDILNDNFLCRYESFRMFKNPSDSSSAHNSENTSNNESPQDILDRAHKEITKALAEDLLSEIMNKSPDFFERLVVELLQKMGYGGAVDEPGLIVGQTGDEGIDGIIKEDKLGFNMIYIQAKRWDPDRSVGRPEIQKFVGALAGQGASKGLFITTAKFSQQAQDYVKKQHTTKVVLVDGLTLAKLMIDYDLGVSTVSVYPIKKLDTDFFEGMI